MLAVCLVGHSFNFVIAYYTSTSGLPFYGTKLMWSEVFGACKQSICILEVWLVGCPDKQKLRWFDISATSATSVTHDLFKYSFVIVARATVVFVRCNC